MEYTLASRLREIFRDAPSYTIEDLSAILEPEGVSKSKISKALYGLKRSGFLTFDGRGNWIKKE